MVVVVVVLLFFDLGKKFVFSGLPSSKVVAFNFQKTQYCVTVSILYSWVGSQEPLIIFNARIYIATVKYRHGCY